MTTYPLASTLRVVAGLVDPAKVSTTKWNPVRDLIAEALAEDPDNVYAITVSKPGNLSVRLDQSSRGQTAQVIAAMYTGKRAELERCIEAAAKRCAGRKMILVFAEDALGWNLAAVVKPRVQAIPAAVAAQYPGASVVNC